MNAMPGKSNRHFTRELEDGLSGNFIYNFGLLPIKCRLCASFAANLAAKLDAFNFASLGVNTRVKSPGVRSSDS